MTSVHLGKPDFTPDEAARLARRYFGLAASARELPSERDQNFLLQMADGERYVLKVANAADIDGLKDAAAYKDYVAGLA